MARSQSNIARSLGLPVLAMNDHHDTWVVDVNALVCLGRLCRSCCLDRTAHRWTRRFGQRLNRLRRSHLVHLVKRLTN
jgi:hypothetical protein